MAAELQDHQIVAACSRNIAEVRAALSDAIRLEGAWSGYVAAYRLVPLLSEQPEAEVIASPSFEVRAEKRPCKADCGQPFQPGQVYLPDGPYHFICKPLGNLDRTIGQRA